jgi:hypothetical protein
MFFPQVGEPGETVQVDWTHGDELGVTIKPGAGLCAPAVPCGAALQQHGMGGTVRVGVAAVGLQATL